MHLYGSPRAYLACTLRKVQYIIIIRAILFGDVPNLELSAESGLVNSLGRELVSGSRPGPSVAGPLLPHVIWGTPQLFCLHSALREISQQQRRHILLHYSSYSRPPDLLMPDPFDPTGLYTMEYEACPVFKSHLELLTNFLFVNHSFVPLVQLMTNAPSCR